MVFWLWATATALARSWAVEGAGGDFDSIQEAVDAASDGDTVFVGIGTWVEAVDLNGKTLELIGAGAGLSMIEPPAGLPAVRMVLGEGGRLEGCTLAPSGARGIEIVDGAPVIVQVDIEGAGNAALAGGGIWVSGAASVVLEDVEISGATALRGGGLYVGDGASARVDGLVVADAVATWGGGVYATGASLSGALLEVTGSWSDYSGSGVYAYDTSLDFDELRIVDASGDLASGAGMMLLGGSTLVARGGRVEGCGPVGAGALSGGGIRLEGGSLVLDGLRFEGNSAWAGGALSLDGAASAALTDVVFDGNSASDEGGAAALAGASSLDCTRCTFTANDANDGGALFAGDDAQVTDVDGDWSGNSAWERGGAVRSDESLEIVFDGSAFDGNQAGSSGGAVSVDDLFLPLLATNATAEGNRSEDGDGGVFAFGSDTTAVVAGGRFVDNDAELGSGGAISFEPGLGSWADLSVVGATFDGNTAAQRGGAVDAWRGGVVLFDSVSLVDGTAGEDGGAISARDVVDVVVLRSAAHGNEAGDAGGALFVQDVSGVVSLTSTTWTENASEDGGAVAAEGSAVEVVNNTFLANDASSEGGHVRLSDGALAFVNNIAAWAVDGGGVWVDAASADATDTYYNDTFSNGGGDWAGSLSEPSADSGNLGVDPLLRAWSPNGLLDDDLHLLVGSPCIDAGEPTLFDLDGSRSDIGAYGGPLADVADLDGDGWLDHVDCDDNDPARNPGAIEVPYDGIDQDCDGWDLLDLDGDGYYGGIGGDDCDDTDPTIHAGAPDAWYDGVDSDCAGNSDFDQDGDGADADAFGGSDCDDLDPLRSPAATEIWYDGLDSNCDGASDFDQDGDGRDALEFGGTDCNDLDPLVFPGAVEHCDGVDEDCDGLVDDDAVDPSAWFVDADADGWGVADAWTVACSQPPASSSLAGDCDDADPLVHPGAEEVWYDGTDQDCDGRDDDQDGDGWPLASDCDDQRSEAHPGALEIHNGLDDDCDGFAEDADRDADGLSDWDEWAIGTDHLDPDSDRDSLPDGVEVPDPASVPDTDGDGLIDPLDDDDDDDGIPTSREVKVDADLDGRPDPDVDRDGVDNHLDRDTDGDGLLDIDEGEDDLDRDGVPDYADFTGGLAGGGCAGGGGAASLFVLPLFLRRRLRTGGLLLAPAAASAQGVDGHGLELFGSSSSSFTRVLPVATGAPMEVDLGVIFDQAARPVVEVLPDERVALLKNLATANLVAAFHPTDRVRVDFAAPLHLAGMDAGGLFAGPGDLRVGAAIGLVAPRGLIPGVVLEPTAWLPTGAESRNVGTPDPAGGLVASVGHDTRLRLGAQRRVAGRPDDGRAQPRRGLRSAPGRGAAGLSASQCRARRGTDRPRHHGPRRRAGGGDRLRARARAEGPLVARWWRRGAHGRSWGRLLAPPRRDGPRATGRSGGHAGAGGGPRDRGSAGGGSTGDPLAGVAAPVGRVGGQPDRVARKPVLPGRQPRAASGERPRADRDSSGPRGPARHRVPARPGPHEPQRQREFQSDAVGESGAGGLQLAHHAQCRPIPTALQGIRFRSAPRGA
jgi:hypothetical protein